MSTVFDAPIQRGRDFRSASKDWKRDKDSSIKWSFGSRPSAGCRLDLLTGDVVSGSESQRAKVRPCEKAGHGHGSDAKKERNITKFTRHSRTNRAMPSNRVRSKMSAYEEMDDDNFWITDPPPMRAALALSMMSASDKFLYSFDRADSPSQHLALDAFVKQPTARDTERFVEREYEILDTNGQAIKGRKARRILRNGAPDLARGAVEPDEDEGFELV